MNSVEAEVGKVFASIEALSEKITKAEGQLNDAQEAGDGEAVRLWLQRLTALDQQKNLLLEKEARLQSGAAGEASGVLTLEQFQAGLQGLLGELRKKKERKPKSFSRVGSTEAQNLLADLDFAEEVGNLEDPIRPPPDVPVADGFDYSRYPNEDTGTPALLKHHKQQLQKYGVSFGRGAFEMYDIHDNKKLFSFVAPDESEFTGTADGLLAPFGLYPESAARQCRALFEHKQTEEQKQSYRDNNPNLEGGSGKDAGPPGPVQYKAHRGQALVCYLASLKTSSFPLIYDLCDGETHNLLHLRDGFIKVWEGLSPTQAYWKLAQLLLHTIPAANDKRLSLDAIPEEFQVPLKKLKGLEPSSQILEQLESILPFVHESERFACTQELLAPWLHSFKIPESIRHMYN